MSSGTNPSSRKITPAEAIASAHATLHQAEAERLAAAEAEATRGEDAVGEAFAALAPQPVPLRGRVCDARLIEAILDMIDTHRHGIEEFAQTGTTAQVLDVIALRGGIKALQWVLDKIEELRTKGE